MTERWLILGGSSGLGSEFLKQAEGTEVYEISRTGVAALGDRSRRFDLSKENELQAAIDWIKAIGPTHIICFVGGGPFGAFLDRPWHSHEWALKVTFLAPAKILHSLKLSELKFFYLVGSAVAESQADAGAASYSAAKHALLGLAKSLWSEGVQNLFVFSPGYMRTRLLPEGSWPRLQNKAVEPRLVAEELWQFVHDANAPRHLVSKYHLGN